MSHVLGADPSGCRWWIAGARRMLGVEQAASLSASGNDGTSGLAIGLHGRPKVRAVPDPARAVLAWLVAPGVWRAASVTRGGSTPAWVDGIGGLYRNAHRSVLPGQRTDRSRGPSHLLDLQSPAGVPRLRPGRQRHDGILGRNVGARSPTMVRSGLDNAISAQVGPPMVLQKSVTSSSRPRGKNWVYLVSSLESNPHSI